MKQKVKNISYLCVVKFSLDQANKDLAFIPSGAEVISLNLEIIEPLTASTTINIGLEKTPNYFLNDIKADKKGFNQSSVLLSASTNQMITATITNPAKVLEGKEVEENKEAKESTETKGKNKTTEPKPVESKTGLACLRVQYFLRSEIDIEI
ncbi:hypothetical protein [Helicobacter suis]|uniref:hypothetical protein n=1 Tax=Helicobacter suis TaxID=104628 RepID=UPI0013CF562C|nr:hypothetical protein [Helicobacter suis]